MSGNSTNSASDTSATVTPPQDVSSATLLAALEVTGASYGFYMSPIQLGDEDGSGVVEGVDPAWSNLVTSGWTMITSPNLGPLQTITDDHYQGVAFYKVVDGVTEIIIGNRGSQPAPPGTAPYQLYDFLHSDAELAVGITPASDTDAVNYYKAVALWATQNLSGPINITEVGHSLGGEEADYVEVVEQNSGQEPYTTNAVTFDAPGLPRGTKQSGVTYDALNISMNTDLVHSLGSLANSGYGGTSLEIPGGKSLAPYELEYEVGRLIPGPLGWLISAGGAAGALYTGLVVNHMVSNLYAYFAEHSDLAGVSLLSLNPAQVTPDGMTGTPDYPSTGVDGAGMNETFTVTDNSTGEVLQGSDGDSVTVTELSSGANITDSSGDEDSLTYSGSVLTSAIWSTSAGVRGADYYNPDGSSTSTVYYSTGGRATVVSDGQGNIATDYYNSSGYLFAWSAVHADGTTISGTNVDSGLTLVQGSSSFPVPLTGYQTVVNPDGSYVTENWDPEDQVTTTNYDASGNKVSTDTFAGPGQNYVVATETTTSDSAGDTETTARDSTGDIVWQSWQDVDGTSGKTTYNASGVVETKDVNADGSAEVTFSELTGITHNYLDSDSNLASDNWSLNDGTSGRDTFGADGSGTGTINYSNGLVSKISIDSSLDITISNENSSGKVVTEDWWHPNGTHGITVYNTDGSSAQYSYTTSGLVVETDYAADGTVTDQQTTNAGATFSPDGSEFGAVQNSDGTSSIDYTNSNGETIAFNVSASGTLESLIHVSTAQSSLFNIPMQNGGSATSGYNGFTPVVTSSDGTTTISYLNSSGHVTGDDWSKTSGNQGYDTFNADGSSTGVNYSGDGSYYTYTNDGVGDVTTEYYNATSTLTSDAWQGADGSHGSDTYNADGSSTGDDYRSDGSYIVYSDDGQGNITEDQYAADGTLMGDTWQKSDGSYGTDTLNADGSKSGVGYDRQGDSETYSEDASGNKLANYYGVTGQLVQRIWTLQGTGGANVAYTFDRNGNLLSQTVTSANGTTSTVAGEISGAESNLTIDSGNGHSLVGAAGGGLILAWGNQDTLTSGGGSSLIDAGGNDDFVTGGSGNDTLGALGAGTTLSGGVGNETFVVGDATDVVEANVQAASNTLVTSVSYTLPTNVDVATAAGSGNVTIQGNNDATNVITGNSGTDSLIAGAGQDTLYSGTGVDTLVGGPGSDTFVVNNSNDEIEVPYGNGNDDTIVSSVNYVLTQPVSTLALMGSDALTATDDYGFATLIGNGGADTLVGGSFDDTLIAGSGIDTLVAGHGNNTLWINNTADVIELGNVVGNDTVESSVSYTLQSSLDTLVLEGSGALVGTGNSDAFNSITGNQGDNTLIAGSGTDTLIAGGGTDTLVAGTGSDVIEGRSGDTYVLNRGFGSTLIDLGQGAGTIQFGAGIMAADLSVNAVVDAQGNFALQISDGSSVLTLDDGQSGGTSEFSLLSNASLEFQFADGTQLDLAKLLAAAQVSDVSLTGTYGNLVLNSDADASISGGTGDDTLIGTGADDTIVAGSGNQVLYGLGNGDVVLGGVGADTLYGGNNTNFESAEFSTVIYGGTGSNTYFLNGSGPTTIDPNSGETGIQYLVLPAGLTVKDLFAQAGSNGDLILTGASETSSATVTLIIKGFFDQQYPDAWMVTDQNSNLVQLATMASAPSTGGGAETGSEYEARMAGVILDDQASLLGTLNEIGTKGGLIEYPGGHESATNFTYQGVAVDNLAVDGGNLTISGDSETETYNSYSPPSEPGIFGSYPVTQNTVTYGTDTVPASYGFLPSNSPDVQQIEQELEVMGETLGPPTNFGGESGWAIYIPPQSYPAASYQTVTHTEPVVTNVTTETLGFTEYDVTGSGNSVSISAAGPFVGTVATGNGNNDSVDLGLQYKTYPSYRPTEPPEIGALIDVGNGLDDSIQGTGGADTVIAGLGIDSIMASCGSTIYVPMTEGAVDTINVINGPHYGNGPFPHNTLVLPEGVTPENLQIREFNVAGPGFDDGQYTGPAEVLQLRYGGSTVAVDFDSGPPSWEAFGNQSWDTDGINYFEFADGTVLTRPELLALAGTAIDATDYNPIITQAVLNVAPEAAVAASSLFTVSDDSSAVISEYLITNGSSTGAYFTLDGRTYGEGAEFEVSAAQLLQLQYVAGAFGSSPQFTVSAFDGVIWGASQTINLTVGGTTIQSLGPDQTVQATGADERVVGSTAGSDTLIGGFDQDELDGESGHDTFVYDVGGGSESINAASDANGVSANTLQFGPGITPASLTLSIGSNGTLVISTANPHDDVTVESFNPLAPYSSQGPTIDQFAFSGGPSLTLEEFLSQIQSSSGSVSVGANTYEYVFNAVGGPLYSLLETNASGQLLDSTTIGSDGSCDTKHYQYNSDGTEILNETKTASDGTDLWASQITLDARGRVSSEIIWPSDGSTVNEAFVYNSDGSYQETVITTPANGGTSTTVVYDYDANGNLITGNQASGADQTVSGPASGPDTLTGGYTGDTLVGASGQDTFVYDAGSGAETISETVSTSSSSANVLQFGAGIAASALIGNINADGSLMLSIGTSGDSVTLEGFDPLNPLSSMPIQQFDFADGSDLTFTQLLSQMQSSGTELSVTNADGTTSLYDFNAAPDALYYDKLNASGQLVQEYILNMDGSTETDSYTRNADGSYADTQVQTTSTGVATRNVIDIDAQGNETSSLTTYPGGSTDYVTYDSQGRHATEIQTDTSGNTESSTFSYNSDGSSTVTTVNTPAGGGATTTVVSDVDAQGNLVSSFQTNPDGSTQYDSWNAQGQTLSEVNTAADGSSTNTTFAYNADGSYTTTDVETPAGGTPVTTEVASYDSSGNELNDNSYTPGTNGSYSDYWQKPDGSYGSYWWNSSTGEYSQGWNDANGTNWTDDYQYSSGGSPGGTGVSFTETYSDGAGDQGTRQYDATTGTTTVTWYSSATGTITGTVTDSGFIGLQNDGELTNTQPDLTFFNPTTSPTFQNFLAGH